MRSPKWLFVILLVVFSGLQYRLWVGEGSFTSAADLLVKIDEQKAENETLHERNRILYAEILELKEGYETVEERARSELGMVKPGETLYQLIDSTKY
ncbi:Cell division protein FtsB [compost metagenome]|jgi:cell division protein FtsB|uniref:cell division protein FtsB n=1 Tax=Pseudomonas sp. PLMAX TaxID=2201998 RepID=UPI000FA50DD5